MEARCWKCGSDLESKREKYCPSCGIVHPLNGKKMMELFRARAERACRRKFAVQRVLGVEVTNGAEGGGVKMRSRIVGVAFFGPIVAIAWLLWNLVYHTDNHVKMNLLFECLGAGMVACLGSIVFYLMLIFTVVAPLELRENRCKRIQESFEKVHPDVRPEASLLRASALPLSNDALLRPVVSVSMPEEDRNQLLRSSVK